MRERQEGRGIDSERKARQSEERDTERKEGVRKRGGRREERQEKGVCTS